MFDYHMHSRVSFDGHHTGLDMAKAAQAGQAGPQGPFQGQAGPQTDDQGVDEQ